MTRARLDERDEALLAEVRELLRQLAGVLSLDLQERVEHLERLVRQVPRRTAARFKRVVHRRRP